MTLHAHTNQAALNLMPLSNFSASTAPTVNDDVTAGYGPGSRWFDLINGKAYICFVSTTGAAEWEQIGSASDIAAMRQAFVGEIARQAIGRFDLEHGIVDGYVNTDGINTTSSVNYSHSTGLIANSSISGTTTLMSLGMTSNTTPSPLVASASSSYSSLLPYKAFNGSSAQSDCFHAYQSTFPIYLYLDLGATYTIAAYSLASTYYSGQVPTAWTFDTSTDGSEYTTQDTQSGSPGSGTTYTLSTPVACRYIRLTITADAGYTYGGNHCTAINEMGIYEAGTGTQNEITLISSTATLTTAPTNGYVYYLAKDAGDGDTLIADDASESNNNLRCYLTANGWTDSLWVPVSCIGEVDDGVYAYESVVKALTNPSTAFAYKFTSHNIGDSAPSVELHSTIALVA